MRISDWSSDGCSSDLVGRDRRAADLEADLLGARGGEVLEHDAAVGLAVAVVVEAEHEVVALDAHLGAGRLEIQDDDLVGRDIQHDRLARRGPRHHERRLGLAQSRRRLASDERSEEHTSELQSLMRISYAVFFLKKKK